MENDRPAENEGMLYLCATPIGNLEDMTPRAVRILREADLIAAEDTRNSLRLLNHFQIHTPLTSYHEYNKIQKAQELVLRMKQGTKVALITDAGMPGISDPGEDLVRMCLEADIPVTCVPGACAAVTALTISGLPSRRFCFEAFLPREKRERQAVLLELQKETRTIILYEAPHRLKRTLKELYEALGERRIALCRELTKVHETVSTAMLSEAIAFYEENEPRGEYVLVLSGTDRRELEREKQLAFQEQPLKEHLQCYLDSGMDRKEAMKAVAKDRGIPKREVYQALLDDDE